MARVVTAANGVLASVASFVVLLIAAVTAYPGGTWDDRSHAGYHPTDNVLCDLLLPVAINGEPNPLGSMVTRAAMLVLSAGVVVALLHVPIAPSKARTWIRRLAFAAIPGLLMVCLGPITPGAPFVEVHAIGVFIGGGPALAAAALAIFAMRVQRWPTALGTAMLLSIGAALIVYAVYLSPHDELLRPLAILQRPSVALLLSWLVAVALAMRRQA